MATNCCRAHKLPVESVSSTVFQPKLLPCVKAPSSSNSLKAWLCLFTKPSTPAAESCALTSSGRRQLGMPVSSCREGHGRHWVKQTRRAPWHWHWECDRGKPSKWKQTQKPPQNSQQLCQSWGKRRGGRNRKKNPKPNKTFISEQRRLQSSNKA